MCIFRSLTQGKKIKILIVQNWPPKNVKFWKICVFGVIMALTYSTPTSSFFRKVIILMFLVSIQNIGSRKKYIYIFFKIPVIQNWPTVFGVIFTLKYSADMSSPWVTQGSFWVTQELFLGHPGVVLGNPGVILWFKWG